MVRYSLIAFIFYKLVTIFEVLLPAEFFVKYIYVAPNLDWGRMCAMEDVPFREFYLPQY